MRLTQEVIDKIAVAMQHTKICLLYTSDAADDMQCVDLGGHFAGDKFISIINRTRSNTTKK